VQPCQWDEVINDEFLFENSDANVEILTDSVVQWKLAPPSFGKVNLTEQDLAVPSHFSSQNPILQSNACHEKRPRARALLSTSMS
jgi:hypothetical protein